MRCALYFGSFNPLHIGHVAIALYVLASPDIDTFRFVLSPHNPLKEADTLEDALKRLDDLKKAVQRMNSTDREKQLIQIIDKYTNADNIPPLPAGKRFEVSDIEFHLPPPLYTYNTLMHLSGNEPDTSFILIIGADNLAIIEKWHKWKEILSRFEVHTYPRAGYDTPALCKKYGTIYIDAPLIDISSTQIRRSRKWEKWRF